MAEQFNNHDKHDRDDKPDAPADPLDPATEAAAGEAVVPGEADLPALRELAEACGVTFAEGADPRPVVESICRTGPTRYERLSAEALALLARLYGLKVNGASGKPALIKLLKRNEGFRGRMRKRLRRWTASALVAMLGEQHVPEAPADAEGGKRASLKDDFERRGVAPALADRLKGAADEYISLKLDEIETRLDRKLDEIDQRLAQWRDREIENRLKIIRITLTATVIVALISVAYAWIKKHLNL